MTSTLAAVQKLRSQWGGKGLEQTEVEQCHAEYVDGKLWVQHKCNPSKTVFIEGTLLLSSDLIDFL